MTPFHSRAMVSEETSEQRSSHPPHETARLTRGFLHDGACTREVCVCLPIPVAFEEPEE